MARSAVTPARAATRVAAWLLLPAVTAAGPLADGPAGRAIAATSAVEAAGPDEPTAPDQAPTGEEVAARFAANFISGNDAGAAALMDATMRGALTAERSAALRAGLKDRNGPVAGLGTAWHEGDVAGYRRYRVPVRFERAEIDLRVVLDGAGRVAGLFVVDHLPPPWERPQLVAPVREVEVRVGEAESGLAGTFSLPDGEGPFAGVVLVHGSGPNDRDETIGPNKPFRDLAWGLAERGVAVLRYDKRSFARPGDLLALGDALTVEQEVIADARLALALLRSRPEIDKERLWIAGHSLGGTLAPRIAETAPRPAGLVILAGGALPLPEKTLEQMEYIFRLDGTIDADERARLDAVATSVRRIRDAIEGRSEPPAGRLLGAPVGYFRDLEAYDAPARAAASGLPILALQGERDYQVTLDGDFARWSAALRGKPGACLLTLPGLDHLFFAGEGPSSPADYERLSRVEPVVLDTVAGFILRRSCPAASD